MEVKELLDKEIKEVNSNEYSEIKISLYTKITKFVKLEITSGEDKIVAKSNDKGYSFEIVDSEDNKISFYTSEEINEGLYLDDIPRDTYYLFLKLT